jgi:hypothetical protein
MKIAGSSIENDEVNIFALFINIKKEWDIFPAVFGMFHSLSD